LSKIAKVVSVRKSIAFEDVFVDYKKFTYVDEDNLTLLTKKAQVFFLKIFGNVYQRLGQSSIVEGQREKITYKLASLELVVDNKQISLEFSSEHLPLYAKFNYCHRLLYDRTGIKNNVTSLLSYLSKLDKSKSNLEEIFEADEDSSQDQRIENENNILEVFQKDKQVLSRVKQAYSAALEKFLNTNI
ncbi:12518_t:CDS:2, partial [Cetraspora pellucida]